MGGKMRRTWCVNRKGGSSCADRESFCPFSEIWALDLFGGLPYSGLLGLARLGTMESLSPRVS